MRAVFFRFFSNMSVSVAVVPTVFTSGIIWKITGGYFYVYAVFSKYLQWVQGFWRLSIGNAR